MKVKLLLYMPFGGKDYISFLEKRFNVEVLTTLRKRTPHLVLFTGGADVHPSYYNEKVGDFTITDKDRDNKEFEIFEHCSALGIPMLGICRGAQLLCVANRGKLVQHVTGHAIGGLHEISEEREGEGMITHNITSTHHQMMYPFILKDIDYSIIAHSTTFLSNIYLNENNENLSVIKNFLEPEIVYFRRTRSLSIQGHPELKHCPNNTKEYCLDQIENYLNLKVFNKENTKKSKNG